MPGEQSLTADNPLDRERSHLAASRSALRAMRADVEALDIRDVTANWVNAAVLQSEIDARIKALADLVHTPLFFGRLDYEEGEAFGGEEVGHRFYIGRRHVHDADGDPMVIDWRAPVSQPFYRASRTDPQDVALRRRFGYTGGELTAYEDEHLTDPAEAQTSSKLLQQEIERPRVGPMRDIVATIQPEQDEIVRAGVGGTVCVQGAPGTGKTAVGLHRVAYLLYAHRERLARSGTLVIGPNASFLHYIEQVLPALGELSVKQATVDDLVAHVPVKGTDPATAAGVKGDARMAEVLRRAVRSGIRMPTEPVVVVRGSRRWRIPAYELEELVRELMERDIRYGAAREALPQRIAHAVLVRMEAAGEAPDDRVQDAVARNAAVKAAVKELWPPVDPAKTVLRLLSDPEFLAACAEGVLTEEEQKEILWEKAGPLGRLREVVGRRRRAGRRGQRPGAPHGLARPRRAGRGPGPLPHAVPGGGPPLLHRLRDRAGRPRPGHHPVGDGDLGGGAHPPRQAGVADRGADPGLPRPAGGHRLRLPAAAGDRTRAEGGDLRPGEPGRLLGDRGPGGRADPGRARRLAGGHLDREGSIGLIAADARLPALAEALAAAGLPYLSPGEETTSEVRLTLVPASLAKGLEYDYVVLDEPAAVVDGEPDERTGLRRLYVALTRAVSGLAVLHAAPLPEALRTA